MYFYLSRTLSTLISRIWKFFFIVLSPALYLYMFKLLSMLSCCSYIYIIMDSGLLKLMACWLPFSLRGGALHHDWDGLAAH